MTTTIMIMSIITTMMITTTRITIMSIITIMTSMTMRITIMSITTTTTSMTMSIITSTARTVPAAATITIIEHHHHHADEVFTSWGKETPHKFTKAKIEDVLKTLCETDDYGTILRAKGMVEDENGSWIYFDMVPGEYELRDGEPDYTGRLCVIGTDIDEHRLEELFGIA